MLRTIIPPAAAAAAQPPFNPDEIEEVYLENVDPTRRSAHAGAAGGNAYDDDDDDDGHGHGHAHGPGVQCGQM